MPYTHLTTPERYAITHMHMAGFSNAQIASKLQRHPATIARELRRNQDQLGSYHYIHAQQQAQQRRSHANRVRSKLTPRTTLSNYVCEKLEQRWSPQQIAGRIVMDHPDDPTMRITHETIYRWIYQQYLQGNRWFLQLRRQHHQRRRRCPGHREKGCLPGFTSIDQRPQIVDQRQRYGDWEADTIEGSKGTGAIATHVERKSRYTLMSKLKDKRADTLTESTCSIFKVLPRSLRRTSTFDNGKEFAGFKVIEKRLKMDVYFAHPRAPWERGTNENTNGLLRDWFPKGSDFRLISEKDVAEVQRMLNNRPRKCLGYRTPAEVLNALPGVALRN